MRSTSLLGVVLVHVLTGCGTDTAEPPLFPDDYATTYTEVRDCRYSIDHDLMRIRVLAAPDALTPYMSRTMPFPTGAIVIKEQYGGDDTNCSGPIVNFTAMQKLDVGTAPSALDWTWQKVDGNHHTIGTDLMKCTRCHTDCGMAPEGYDGTCTMP